MIIFDGKSFAAAQEKVLLARIAARAAGAPAIRVAAILFTEDHGSVVYSRLKQEAAMRLGISYELHQFSLTDAQSLVLEKISALVADPAVTGVIIQKPMRRLWHAFSAGHVSGRGSLGEDQMTYRTWWRDLTGQLSVEKDVDGLHPQTLRDIENGTWQAAGHVLPATVRAVLSILDSQQLLQRTPAQRVVILGKSDILGTPLYAVLRQRGVDVEVFGDLELGERGGVHHELHQADILITATGHPHVITKQLVKKNVAIIDVGEPKPDVDRESVAQTASFLTPVPGGVGPVTVISLMQNAVELAERNYRLGHVEGAR